MSQTFESIPMERCKPLCSTSNTTFIIIFNNYNRVEEESIRVIGTRFGVVSNEKLVQILHPNYSSQCKHTQVWSK